MPWRWPWYRRPKEIEGDVPRHPLREFVYLDEVSVYSLLASRSGPVPTEFTDTETASLKDEVSGSASVGVPGTKAQTGVRMETSTGTSSQIVRKSSAQARFKQFLEAEEDGFVFSVSPGSPAHAVPPSMRRGDLFEMDVELDAHETFRITQTITSMLEILTEDGAQLFADVNRGEMSKALAFSRILERLLVNLVPIHARAVDYAVVRPDGGSPQIVPRDSREGASQESDLQPLFVVGFAQRDLFWKDLRTVLFGQHRFTLTGRLTGAGVQDRWSPVKLTEVLRPYMPDVADDLDQAGHHFASAFRASAASSVEITQGGRLDEALSAYIGRIVADPDVATRAREALHDSSTLEATLDGSLERTRAVFDEITERVRDQVGADRVDESQAATHRSAIILEYGLPPAVPVDDGVAEPVVEAGDVNEWYLEAEIIALYW